MKVALHWPSLRTLKTLLRMLKTDPRQLLLKLALVVIPLAGILGPGLSLLLKMYNYVLLSFYIAIPMVLAPVIYVIYRRAPYRERFSQSSSAFKLLVIGFAALFAASLLTLVLFDVRPTGYFFLITAAATILLVEIVAFDVSSRARRSLMLLQITLLGISLLWGVSLKYFYFVGRTDVLVHIFYVDTILTGHHVTDVFSVYEAFPLWHILTSYAYEATGLTIPVWKAMFLFNGIIYAFLPLGIFLLARRLINNNRVALLASLILTVNGSFIWFGMSSISRSVVALFMVVLILLLLDHKNDERIFALALVVTGAIIMYHTVSIIFIIGILLLIYLVYRLLLKERDCSFLSPRYFVVAVAMTLVYWYIFAQILIEDLIGNLTSAAPTGVLTKSILMPLNELLNYVQYSPLLFLLLLGAFFLLKSRKWCLLTIFSLVAVVLAFASFPGPALLVNKLARNLQLERLEDYAFIFITLAAATGLAALYYKSRRNASKFVVIAIFSVLVLASVSNDFVASDNPLVKRNFYTYYFEESEYASFNTVASNAAGLVMSDYLPTRYIGYSQYSGTAQILQIDPFNAIFVVNNSSSNDLILIRQGELAKRPLKLYPVADGQYVHSPSWSGALEYYDKDARVYRTLDSYDKVYASNTVSAYYP